MGSRDVRREDRGRVGPIPSARALPEEVGQEVEPVLRENGLGMELNAVERALLLSPPGELHLDQHLPTSPATTEDGGVLPFPAPLAEIARAAARATLEHCDGNRSESARRLGISRRRLRGLLEDTDQANELLA